MAVDPIPAPVPSWQLWPRGLSRSQIVATVAAVALLGGVVAAGLFDPTVVLAAPIVIGFAFLVVARPGIAFVAFLCLLSLLPIEQQLLGVYVPNWSQAMIPLLLVGAVLYNLRHPERQGFALNWADFFLVAFIIFGLVGVLTQPGPASFKYYINQQAIPAMAYFIAKWLPLDRQRFRAQLRWQLLAMLALSIIMVGRVATGFDPFYHGFRWLGLGGEAVGPMGSISDTVAYTAIFPPFFLYAIAVTLGARRRDDDPLGKRGRRTTRLWWFGLIMALLATMATTERTGLTAIIAGFAVALFNRRLFRPVAIIALVLPLLIPVWMVSPVGQKAMARLNTLKEEGAGFERHIYREKALRYTRSEYWNPVVGTGFGRINFLCAKTMPQNDWFYDYNWHEFRPLLEFAQRNTHCSPVTLYAEYGYAGVVTLAGFALCVLLAMIRARRLAFKRGRRPDDALLLAALGAFLGVAASAMFHNTETVVQVLFMVWWFAGVVIGHPDVFAQPVPPDTMVPADGTTSVTS